MNFIYNMHSLTHEHEVIWHYDQSYIYSSIRSLNHGENNFYLLLNVFTLFRSVSIIEMNILYLLLNLKTKPYIDFSQQLDFSIIIESHLQYLMKAQRDQKSWHWELVQITWEVLPLLLTLTKFEIQVKQPKF